MTLRTKLIRLAHQNPELRAEILPLLTDKTASTQKVSKLMSRQIKILEAYLAQAGSSAARFYDELPASVQAALVRVKDSETLWSDAERWLGDNNQPGYARSLWASEKTAMRGRFSLPRGEYLPKDNSSLRERKDTPEGLQIWVWDSIMGGHPTFSAGAWAGKADKPLWNHYYRNENQRERKIQDTIQAYQYRVEAKRQRMEERKNFQHGFQVGDILVASWGYDQTQNDWFQVVALYGKAIGIREIESEVVSRSTGADMRVGLPDRFTGPLLKKIPQGSGGQAHVKIHNSATAYKWDGKPKYETGWGYGH